MPWSAEAEAAEATRCARYSLGDIENVVHESGVGWELLVEVSMRRVRLLTYSDPHRTLSLGRSHCIILVMRFGRHVLLKPSREWACMPA